MSGRPVSVSADYKPINGTLQRNLIAWVFRLLFPKICFEIDFRDGDVRKIGSGVSAIKVAPPSFLDVCKIMRNPGFLLPQAFVQGKWFVSEGELADFVVRMTRRKGVETKNNGLGMGIPKLIKHIYKQYVNTEATREVKNHYNDDPRVYEIILGESMLYSCAFFDKDDSTLGEAQLNKLETTFDRMKVDSKVRSILDIGCGWGGFTQFASQRTAARIDGISIASSQIDYATKKSANFGHEAQKRIRYFCEDYVNFGRNNSCVYDRVISIGMLEHVGKTQYRRYFGEIHRLLAIEGIALVHTITRSDDGITNDWIDRFIFPGGYIPRLSEVVRGIEDAGLKLENSFRHAGINYKRTLQSWLRNLSENEQECLELFIDIMGRDRGNEQIKKENARRAYRMWYFYFSSIQSIFDRTGGNYDITQFVIRKI